MNGEHSTKKPTNKQDGQSCENNKIYDDCMGNQHKSERKQQNLEIEMD